MLMLSFDRIKSKLTSHQDTTKLQKWLELLNFDCDFSEGKVENCDDQHILDLARHSEYTISSEGHKNDGEESQPETELLGDKLDCLVLDSEKYLASNSRVGGGFDKNLGKINRTYIHVFVHYIHFWSSIESWFNL
jgi:hypothetical protein